MILNWIRKVFSTDEGRTVVRRSSRPNFRPSFLNLEDRVVPATFFVDPTIVGNTGDTVSFNQGRAGQVDGLTLGTNVFQDLGDAVTTAVGGDTIQLAQATIVTNVDFTINETLNFVGSGVGATILNPNASTQDDFGPSAAWFRIIGGATVNFSNVTFNGLASNFGIGEAVRYESSSGTINGAVFTSISRLITGNPFDGVGVVAVDSTVTVNLVGFDNMGRGGAVFTGASNGTFSNSVYTGKGLGDQLDNGIEVSFGASALVTGSTFTNCFGTVLADGSESTAIVVSDEFTSLVAIGNLFQNNLNGVGVGFILNDPVGPVVVNFNTFIGNDVAITTATAPGSEVDGRFNFFGTTNGPTAPQNPTGTGQVVEDLNSLTILESFLRKDTPVSGSTSNPSYISDITPPEIYAVAAGGGNGAPHVQGFVNGVQTLSFFAYAVNFTGGVRVATGDVDGDGIDDIITAAGPGGGAHIKVFDGLTGAEKLSFFAYVPTFSGGAYVTVGDVDGDAIADIITGAGAGGGPHVKVFDGRTGAEKLSFFAYASNFLGGVTVATGDFDVDFIDEIITGAASLGAPHVKVFNGMTAAERLSFFAFDPGFLQGVFVAAGDFDGDFISEIFVGTGGGLPVIGTFNANGTAISQFAAGDSSALSGARISAVDLDGDGIKSLLVGNGPGRASGVTFFNPVTGASFLSDNPFLTAFTGGVFVA